MCIPFIPPQEIAFVLESAGFEILNLVDNEDFQSLDFKGEEMKIVARLIENSSQ